MAGLEQHFTESCSTGDFVKRYISYLSELMSKIDEHIIEKIIEAIKETEYQDKTIYFIGNGGSAATASHFANDIGVGTRAHGIKPFKAVCLADNLATVSALANDEGYDKIYVRQLESMLVAGDLVIALSVSGNSRNVLEAVQYAKEMGALSIGCTGFDGGALREMADINLHVPTNKGEYGPVEDVFMILDHIIYSYLRLERRQRILA